MTVTTTLGLVLAVPVVCWLATGARPVPRGSRVVTVRRGVVRRVRSAGLAVRVPLLDVHHVEPAGARRVSLVLRARTADDVRVMVLSEATVLLPAPRPGTTYADPCRAVEDAAQEAVGRVVGARRAAELLGPGDGPAPLEARPLRHALSAAVDDLGVTLLDLEVVEVDVRLEGALGLGTPAPGRG